MPVKIEFETGNDAFECSGTNEVARILRAIADVLDAHGCPPGAELVFDWNGNIVGSWVATIDAEPSDVPPDAA